MWNEPVKEQKKLIDSTNFDIPTLNNFLMSYQRSKRLSKDGYERTKLTSAMVNSFINGVHVEVYPDCPILSRVYLDEETLLRVNVLKHFSYVALINSS